MLHSNPTKAVHEARARNVDGEGNPTKYGTPGAYKTSSPVGELSPNYRGELAADLVNAQAWAGRATVVLPGDTGWQALTGPAAPTLTTSVAVVSFIDDGNRNAGWPIGWGSHCLAHFGPASGWDAITLGREDDGSGGGADIQFVAVQFTAGDTPTANLFATIPQGFAGWSAAALELEARCSQHAATATATATLDVMHPTTGALLASSFADFTGTTTDYTAGAAGIASGFLGSLFQAGDLLHLRVRLSATTGQNTIRLGRLFLRWI